MAPEVKSTITGLVLAGGLGRRMGGVDKGLQPLRGKPMAAWVLERLESQVGDVLINANQNAEAYAALDKRIVPDSLGGFIGPLAGMHAGLAACSTPLLVSVPCDTPFLPLDLVARLHEGLEGSRADLAVARADGRLQPVFALMRRGAIDSLGAFLEGGGRSVTAWASSLAVVAVDFSDAKAFANINTPEELAGLATPR